MRRRHFFEIHEKSWCPAFLRHGVRGVLQQISSRLPGYEAVIDELVATMREAGASEVLDLCAGAGGPWARIIRRLPDTAGLERVRLTDIFPDVQAMEAMTRRTEGRIVPHPEPVDALDVPRGLSGLRTVFAAFHHFDPQMARRVLASAAATGEGVAVFELTERKWRAIALVGLSAIPITLLVLPFVRPFRWIYVPFTYVVPVLPLIMAFDGVVSCLRTYDPDELLALGREAAPDYEWRAGRSRAMASPFAIVYLTGVPRG